MGFQLFFDTLEKPSVKTRLGTKRTLSDFRGLVQQKTDHEIQVDENG